jgi:hypothetical protein
MPRHHILFALLLPLSMLALNFVTLDVDAQKKNTTPIVYTPPTVTLSASPTLITACADDTGSGTIVRLDAGGTTGTAAKYSWTANAGRIEGNGPTATWNLAGLRPGYYKAKVVVDTGTGTELCEAFASTTVLVRCTPPPPPQPVCPNVTISCPDHVEIDQPITFSASFTGGSGNVTQTYNWTISAGRIIEGQGTPTIVVDTKGCAGQSIKAEFVMGGYPTDCAATCVVDIPAPLTCKKFDEFPNLPRNDEKARLDNFTIELQSDPTSTAYVVIHPGQKGRAGNVQKHTSRIVDYLVNSRGVDARRIVTIVGAAREELMIELVVCPQGARFDSRAP